MKKTIFSKCLAVAVVGLLGTAALVHAQVPLNFTASGGNVTISIPNPITYTITTTVPYGPVFVFQSVGNDFVGARILSTDVQFSINGAGSKTFSLVGSGLSLNDLSNNDLFFYGGYQPLSAGDTVTLSAGSIVVSGATLPDSGSFNTFLTDNTAHIISDLPTAVPEPSTYALFGLGALALIVAARRKTA